ncbi:MAG: hypothetical protein H6674_02855 [Dehalococcoidia bacterium]|nr:hypothetical protein [Dehalococcoidia bacterium]
MRRTAIRLTPWAFLVGVVLAAALAVSGDTAAAQEQAPADTVGRISGEVNLGTEGATLDGDLTVDFIVLVGSEVGGTVDATVNGASFFVEVPLDDTRRYVPRVVYQGVPYFGAPVAVTADAPEATAELPTIYATTSEAPALTIGDTVVTVIALDRGTGQLGFVREDLVMNPADRVFVGDANGVTLRLPAPDSTLDAAGENADGTFRLADGVLTSTVPLRAEEATSIVTRYLVTYDIAKDEYLLRVTTPLAADRLVVRVPETYVRNLEVVGDGVIGEPDVLQLGDSDPIPLRTAYLENAKPGDSLIVRLDGLALQTNRNPLAETPGNIIAGLVALAVVGAAAAYAIARGRSAPA